MTSPRSPATPPVRRRGLAGALRSPWPRLAVLAAVLGGCGWLAAKHGIAGVELARHWVAGIGALGALAFVALYAAGTVSLFPMALFSATAGLLFGPVAGSTLAWAGAVSGACGAFGLGRVISGSTLSELTGPGVDRLDAYLAARGFVAVLVLRLVPLFPFGLLNYGCAVTSVGFRPYLLGTAVGILPGTVIYATVGAHVTNPGSPTFLASTAVLLALGVGGALVARPTWRRLRPRQEER